MGANSTSIVAWDVGDRLREQFAGLSSEAQKIAEDQKQKVSTEARITQLVSFPNANAYSFTRLILQGSEAEQVMNVLEKVQIGGVDLSHMAGTTPIGFCGNHVLLPLKQRSPAASGPRVRFDTSTIEIHLAALAEAEAGTATKRAPG